MARLSCLKKYSLDAAFLMISAIWVFHLRSLLRFRPRSFAPLTNSSSALFTLTRLRPLSAFEKSIRSSLHLNLQLRCIYLIKPSISLFYIIKKQKNKKTKKTKQEYAKLVGVLRILVLFFLVFFLHTNST